jgi:hypothetical protein
MTEEELAEHGTLEEAKRLPVRGEKKSVRLERQVAEI